MNMLQTVFLLLWYLSIFLDVSYSANIVIDTKLGRIRGNVHEANSSSQQQVYSFLGIHYGNAPVGNLRFRQSTVNATLWNGIYDATRYGDVCIQGGAQPQSENCLFINIWTPKPSKNGTLLPVMFWIHGGAFYFGAGSDPIFNGVNLVSTQKDFVYVSINYRLAALGFLSNTELYHEDPNWKSYGGLNGVHDQITALKYVRSFIADYGGDAENITIFGESAGGQSVCYLTVSPLAKGLFKKAIIQSGACGGPWSAGNTTFAIEYSDKSIKANGMQNNLTYLRSLPARKILDINIVSAVDGMVLQNEPVNIFKNFGQYIDDFNPEKIIVGFNSLDGVVGMGYGAAPRTDIAYKEFISLYIRDAQQAELLYSYYYPSSDFEFYSPLNYNKYELAWYTLNSDSCLTCPSLFMANQINKFINSDIAYIYEFGGPGVNGTYYAMHASELAFVFDHRADVIGSGFSWSQSLANQLMSAWTNFGKYGMPNITDPNVYVEWPLYSSGNKSNVIIFEDKPRVNSSFYQNYRRNVCDFWYNQIPYDEMLSICFDLLPV